MNHTAILIAAISGALGITIAAAYSARARLRTWRAGRRPR